MPAWISDRTLSRPTIHALAVTLDAMEHRDGGLPNMFDLSSDRLPRLFDCCLKSRHHAWRLFGLLFGQPLQFVAERHRGNEVAFELAEQGVPYGFLNFQPIQRPRCIIQTALEFA